MVASGENDCMAHVMTELIQQAAQWVVEEGLDYGQAKRRAAEASPVPRK